MKGINVYSVEDLDIAREELTSWSDKIANNRSNNPNKYEAQIRDARIQVREVESYLKDKGLIEKSDHELLNEELDKLHPNAKSNSIHSFNGKQYKIRYFPLVKSRSRKTIKEWGHKWEELK